MAEGLVYTVAVTSCGRHDLLRRTLRSLVATLDLPPREIVVFEDGGDPGARAAAEGLDAPIRVILAEGRLGQMRAIDRLYAEIGTPWAFHCEDDWEFTRTGYVAESHAVLAARPEVSTVSLRPIGELNPLIRDTPETVAGGVRCHLLDPARHPEYFSYTFNPGLRRLSDLHALGPLAAIGGEADVSLAFKRRGFRYAVLAEPAVRHVGWERHVDDPAGLSRPRTPWARWARSARKRVRRLRRRFSDDA